jgi:hypothetical protein
MASTYTPAGIELIADGEQSGTWGQTTNTNWELVEELATGVASVALTGTTHALSVTDGTSSDGRHAIVKFTGSPGGTCTVTVSPNDMQKIYWIVNASDQSVVMTQGSGGNVTVLADSKKVMYCDGAGAGAAVVDLSQDLDIHFMDGDKLTFGDSADLEIYHDGSNSIINDAGTGNLKLQLGGSDKLEVTSAGVAVTGTVDVTSVEATNLKAKDGTASATIADSTGVMTIASSVLTTTDINGGTIDGVTIGGSSAGAITGTTITGTSFVTSGDMTFGDNDKAIFGAGSDLQIYHSGSGSYVKEGGAGSLYLQGTDVRIQNASGEDILNGTSNGAVTLYYDNAPKLATTSTGIDVTGTVTADGLTVENITTGPVVTVNGPQDGTLLSFETNGTERFKLWGQGTGTDYLSFMKDSANLLKINQIGDISFYEATGTTPKFFWDASAESLGIGTSSPSGVLHSYGSNDGGDLVSAIFHNQGGANTSTTVRLGTDLVGSGSRGTYIKAINTGAGSPHDLAFGTNSASSTPTERMRIDSSGNLLVGTTTNPFTVAGANGNLFVNGRTNSNSVAPLRVAKQGDTGSIIDILAGSTLIGSIDSSSGSEDLIINASDDLILRANGQNGVRIFQNGGSLQNVSIGANLLPDLDNSIDIGAASSVRWRNLYLSGGVYLGGTGAANYLDDYEEGTWTATLTTTGTDFTHTGRDTSGSYTKIGNKVTAWFACVISSPVSGGTGDIIITGLPFTSVSTFSGVSFVNSGRFDLAGTHIYAAVGSNDTTIALKYQLNNSNPGSVSANDINGNATPYITGCVTYQTS